MNNTAGIGRGARIIPTFVKGKVMGFRLYAIRRDSVYFRLGFRNGDVVKSINKMDITNPDKALDLFKKWRNAKKFNVEILRGGKSVHLTYRIVKK